MNLRLASSRSASEIVRVAVQHHWPHVAAGTLNGSQLGLISVDVVALGVEKFYRQPDLLCIDEDVVMHLITEGV